MDRRVLAVTGLQLGSSWAPVGLVAGSSSATVWLQLGSSWPPVRGAVVSLFDGWAYAWALLLRGGGWPQGEGVGRTTSSGRSKHP